MYLDTGMWGFVTSRTFQARSKNCVAVGASHRRQVVSPGDGLFPCVGPFAAAWRHLRVPTLLWAYNRTAAHVVSAHIQRLHEDPSQDGRSSDILTVCICAPQCLACLANAQSCPSRYIHCKSCPCKPL
eukprot:4772890-Amphidinium_carterae.2